MKVKLICLTNFVTKIIIFVHATEISSVQASLSDWCHRNRVDEMTSQTLLRHGFTFHATMRITEQQIATLTELSWRQKEMLWAAVENYKMEELSFRTRNEITDILNILK